MRNLLFRFPRRNFNLMGGAKAELPKLDYGYSDLEPVLSTEILTLHHSKHHQTYVDEFNKFSDELKTAQSNNDIEKMVVLTQKIKFHGGSHINHSQYWKNLAPVKNGGGVLPDSSTPLMQQIIHQWGSMDNLISEFKEKFLALQGSGWGNLVKCNKTGDISYVETKDQDPAILNSGKTPLLTIDSWEHAWYPLYKNEKKRYINEIWKIVNWKDVESRYGKNPKH